VEVRISGLAGGGARTDGRGNAAAALESPAIKYAGTSQPSGTLRLKRKWLVVEGTDGHGVRIEHHVCASPGIEEEVSREAPDVSAVHRENGAAPVDRTRHAIVLDAALPGLDARAYPRAIELGTERIVDDRGEHGDRRMSESQPCRLAEEMAPQPVVFDGSGETRGHVAIVGPARAGTSAHEQRKA